MKEKRKVNSNLGRTQHRDADALYCEIKKRIGASRACPFYNGEKYSQFHTDEHNRLNPEFPNPNVPIEQYDFAYSALLQRWGLQAYCKVCYKAYRDARIGKARATWIKKDGTAMTDDAMRTWYKANVGPTMNCSVCKQDLAPSEFPTSRSMEKGLHNECFDCMSAKGTSVREQAWLSDGDWDSWKKAVVAMRGQRNVVCSGWPRTQAMGLCEKVADGKKMHADHRVPLRAGGINDAKNFQPLCTPCNIRKSDQLDPRLSHADLRSLVSAPYTLIVKTADTIPTVERKLKAALFDHLLKLAKAGTYLEAIKRKKREVNGQWVAERAFKKGIEWLNRGGSKLTDPI